MKKILSAIGRVAMVVMLLIGGTLLLVFMAVMYLLTKIVERILFFPWIVFKVTSNSIRDVIRGVGLGYHQAYMEKKIKEAAEYKMAEKDIR